MKLADGSDANVIDQIQVKGRNYFLVELQNARYINGILTKYLICPTQQFLKDVPDQAEVV